MDIIAQFKVTFYLLYNPDDLLLPHVPNESKHLPLPHRRSRSWKVSTPPGGLHARDHLVPHIHSRELNDALAYSSLLYRLLLQSRLAPQE